jgi:hypothetical protein
MAGVEVHTCVTKTALCRESDTKKVVGACV